MLYNMQLQMNKSIFAGLVLGALAITMVAATIVLNVANVSATNNEEKFNARDVAPGQIKKDSDSQTQPPGQHTCDANLISPGHIKDGSSGCGGPGGGDGGGDDDGSNP
jgi:uncharacterized protein YcfJ